MVERGVYQSVNRGRQLLRFDGFKIGNITPTDIDAHIDYHNIITIFFESKLFDKDVPYGQRLALERLVKDAKSARKRGVAMIVEHGVIDPAQDVFLTDCAVREVFTTECMTWRPPKRKINAYDAACAYIAHYARDVKTG